MNVNSCPAYFEHMGLIGESNSLKFTTLGLNEISFIIQAFNVNGNAVNFANQKYSIWCSNDDVEYIKLFDVNLGVQSTVTNSLKEGFHAALYYRHLLITVPQIADVKSKIILSAR